MPKQAGVLNPDLTDKQELFCQNYVVHLNATKAARDAGYSKKTAGSQGHDLLKRPEIQSRIQHLQAKRLQRTEIDQDKVLRQLARLAFSDIKDNFTREGGIVRVEDLSHDASAALTGLKVTKRRTAEVDSEGNPIYEDVIEFKMADKIKSLELLGKHLQLFPNAHQITGKDGGPIETKETGGNDLARRLAFALSSAIPDGE